MESSPPIPAGPGVRLLLGVLATWRVTHLLAAEDGPGHVVLRVRARLGDGWAGTLADCFACMSVWVAAPMALMVAGRRGALLTWPALSGGACLLQELVRGEADLADHPIDIRGA